MFPLSYSSLSLEWQIADSAIENREQTKKYKGQKNENRPLVGNNKTLN